METPHRRRARTPRWTVALAASVALHALLGGFLWHARLPPSPRRPAPIEFVLVDLPPLPGPSDPVARPAPPEAAAGPAGRVRPAPAGAVASGPQGASLPSGGDASGDLSGAPDLAWATPAAPAGASAAPDLSARPPAATVVFQGPPDDSGTARLQRELREEQARVRVKDGLADPFFLDFGRSMLALWDPEKAVADRGITGYAKQLAKSIADYSAVYAEQAATYGRTGSPFPRGEAPLSLAGLAPVPEGISTQISDQMAGMRAIAEQARSRHAALVRVVQRADGRILALEVLRPSGDPSVDAQALRDLRESAEKLPAPTPSALAGRARVASVWEFSLVVSITPPLPMVAVQFDEVLGGIDARLPLDRRLYKLVRLVSVE